MRCHFSWFNRVLCACVFVCACVSSCVRACIYSIGSHSDVSVCFLMVFFFHFCPNYPEGGIANLTFKPSGESRPKKKKSPVCSVIFYPQWVEKWWNHSFGRVGAQCVTQTALTEIWTRVADSVLLLVFCFVNRLIMVGTWEGVACALFKWFSIPRIIRTTD